MDQITHDVRRENWLNIGTQCRNRETDISVKQWLADNGIKEKAVSVNSSTPIAHIKNGLKSS